MYSDKVRASETGRRGEETVAAYLRQNGYIIIKRNWHCDRFGEIDIIAEKDKTVVFVEVKTRSAGYLASGAEAVDTGKLTRTYNAAHVFMSRLKYPYEMRVDVAEVTVDTLPDGTEHRKLRYIENAGL